MTWLVEDPLPIWLCGALAFTFALVAHLQLRRNWSLGLMAAVLLAVVALTLIERWIVTPTEALQDSLYGVLAALEADDLPRTLTFISPTAVEVRADAESAMPRLDIRRARVADVPVITFDGQSRATARFRAIFDATTNPGGIKGGYFDDVEIDFANEDGRWLVVDYRANRSLREEIGRIQKRPMPSLP